MSDRSYYRTYYLLMAKWVLEVLLTVVVFFAMVYFALMGLVESVLVALIVLYVYLDKKWRKR